MRHRSRPTELHWTRTTGGGGPSSPGAEGTRRRGGNGRSETVSAPLTRKFTSTDRATTTIEEEKTRKIFPRHRSRRCHRARAFLFWRARTLSRRFRISPLIPLLMSFTAPSPTDFSTFSSKNASRQKKRCRPLCMSGSTVSCRRRRRPFRRPRLHTSAAATGVFWAALAVGVLLGRQLRFLISSPPAIAAAVPRQQQQTAVTRTAALAMRRCRRLSSHGVTRSSAVSIHL